MQNLRNRLEQVQATRDALQEEHGLNLENQNEIKRLNQMKKNLQTDLKVHLTLKLFFRFISSMHAE